MIGKVLKKERIDRGYTLEELGKIVGKSPSTISRIENNVTTTIDPVLLNKFADALSISTSLLLGTHEDLKLNEDFLEHSEHKTITNLLVEDSEMSPELPKGACVKIRSLMPYEKLQEGAFYYIEVNKKKCFRMVVYDTHNGIGFLPNDISERRIAYDKDYVKIIGKAISMKVIFEDNIEYEQR